ncbi:MAG: hypothetical protein GC180_06540 [Bacteroidetes bacterium]|nr:hypothetical protein [Bacteroidota bacterium]
MRQLKSYWFLLLLAFFVFLGWLGQSNSVNWNETYEAQDKIPFGTFLLREQLPSIFPNQSVETRKRPLSEWLNKTEGQSNLIIIGDQIEFGEVDQDILLNYALDGNNVFIANTVLPEGFYETLGLKDQLTFSWSSDTVTQLGLVNPAYRKDTAKFNRLPTFIQLKSDGSVYYKVLGIDYRTGLPNFVEIPYGLGKIYLHTVPQIFTNIHLTENPQYIARCFSYLPLRRTYWDEYYKPFNHKEKSSLDIILSNKALTIAWYLLLYGSILAVLFFAKRKQRAVPIIKDPENKSLEFIQTIGDLYFNEGNHLDMANKKVRYFFHNAQLTYLLRENEDDFWDKLQQKSGAKEITIRKLKEMITTIHQFKQMSPDYLIRLNSLLEDFYAESGKYPGNK